MVLGKRHVSHRQKHGSRIHGQHRRLGHAYNGGELAAVQQRNEPWHGRHYERQHGRDHQQGHFYLPVHRRVDGRGVVVYGREARKIVGLHRREHHSGVCHGKDVAGVVQPHHVKPGRRVQERAHRHLGPAAQYAGHNERQAEAHHAPALSQRTPGSLHADRKQPCGETRRHGKVGQRGERYDRYYAGYAHQQVCRHGHDERQHHQHDLSRRQLAQPPRPLQQGRFATGQRKRGHRRRKRGHLPCMPTAAKRIPGEQRRGRHAHRHTRDGGNSAPCADGLHKRLYAPPVAAFEYLRHMPHRAERHAEVGSLRHEADNRVEQRRQAHARRPQDKGHKLAAHKAYDYVQPLHTAENARVFQRTGIAVALVFSAFHQ